jgi:hypothetical protein
VTQRTTYVDLGATAMDAVDGLVEVVVNARQLQLINTSLPTPPNQNGSMIEFTATDAAGNTARMKRTVRVLSPCLAPSFLCALPLVRHEPTPPPQYAWPARIGVTPAHTHHHAPG